MQPFPMFSLLKITLPTVSTQFQINIVIFPGIIMTSLLTISQRLSLVRKLSIQVKVLA